MHIKWNWGTKIFLAYTVFVGGMLFLVYLCTQQHFDLVRSDYYEAEIAYQKQMTSSENTLALGALPTIVDDGETIAIKLPAGMAISNGEAFFYKPDNADLDKRFAMDANGVSVSKSALGRGAYTVKITWYSNGKEFYHEEKVFVN